MRYEDATLANLSEMACEILNGHTVPAGSVFLIGSASHLFKVGTGTYPIDWVNEIRKLEQKFKNVSFCPLAPIFRENSPGSLIQDLETLTVWYHMIYDNNIKGMLTTWNAILHYAQNAAIQPASTPHKVLLKLPLPQMLKLLSRPPL
jgi:hypothetical protein